MKHVRRKRATKQQDKGTQPNNIRIRHTNKQSSKGPSNENQELSVSAIVSRTVRRDLDPLSSNVALSEPRLLQKATEHQPLPLSSSTIGMKAALHHDIVKCSSCALGSSEPLYDMILSKTSPYTNIGMQDDDDPLLSKSIMVVDDEDPLLLDTIARNMDFDFLTTCEAGSGGSCTALDATLSELYLSMLGDCDSTTSVIDVETLQQCVSAA